MAALTYQKWKAIREHWTPKPISPTCEHGCGNLCGRVTAAVYPAMGGGWAALCAEHAVQHCPYAWSVYEVIADGERFE